MLLPPKPSSFPRLKIFPFQFAVGVKPFIPRSSLLLPCRIFHAQLCDSISCYCSSCWDSFWLPPQGVCVAFLHQLPFFFLIPGSCCNPHGRRPALVQFISPKTRHNREILLKSVCIASKGHVELLKRHLCLCGGGGGREGQFSPQIPPLRGLFAPWGFFCTRDCRSWEDKKHFCGFPSVDLRENEFKSTTLSYIINLTAEIRSLDINN